MPPAQQGDDPTRPSLTYAGEKRNAGGRPTAVEMAAKDPTQLRLSFGVLPSATGNPGGIRPPGTGRDRTARNGGLLAPPAAAAPPKIPSAVAGGSTWSDVPERSTGAAQLSGTLDLDAAMAAVREGRGESLTKRQLVALLVGLLAGGGPLGTSAVATGMVAPTSSPVVGTPLPDMMDDSAPPAATPVQPGTRSQALPPVDRCSGVETPQREPVPPPWATEPSPVQEDAAARMARWADYEPLPGDFEMEQWETVSPASKSKGKGKGKAPKVSPPTFTETPDPPKRVILRVSPPKAKAGEADNTSTLTKVVFDGIPTGTTFLGFSRILDKFYAECAGVVGSDFPVAPMTASTHLLGQGGWVVSYKDAETATRVLGQDPGRLAAAAGIDPALADIHRPGTATRRGEQVTAKTARSVYMHIEPTILGEIWDVVRSEIRKDIEDPQWASYGVDPAGKARKPAIPSIPAHRVLLQEALVGALRAPEGSTFENVQILGVTGAVIGLLSSAEAATRAIAEGIMAPALARRIVARAAHRPDQRGGLAFCTRCMGVGHRPHQCDQKPRCRVCGGSGHPESNGVCPKNKRHPAQPAGNNPFCVLCGMPGHKAGAPTCAEMQRTRKTLTKGADGTYADSVAAVRAARVEAARVTASAVRAGAGGNAWANPLPGTGAAAAHAGGARAHGHPQAQADLKMDRLERALHEMQAQMAMMMQVISAGLPPAAPRAAPASQVQECDQSVTPSLAMQD